MRKVWLPFVSCFFLLSVFMCMPLFAIETVRQAAEGLSYPSETDAPFETIFWPEVMVADLVPEKLIQLLGVPENTPIETVSVEAFFSQSTETQEWHDAEEATEVERFRALVQCIKETLADAQVFRVGKVKIDCYIVGNVKGGCGGLKTQAVET